MRSPSSIAPRSMSCYTAHRHAQQNGHRLILVGADALAQRVIELTGTQFLLHENGTADVKAWFTRMDLSTHIIRILRRSGPRDCSAG